MYTRRSFLMSSVAAAAGIGLSSCRDSLQAGTSSRATATEAAAMTSPVAPATALNTRVVPSTGEKLPVIGMGTSGSFEVGAAVAERDPLREVLTRFLAAGGTVIDTAPTYSVAEDVMGELLLEQELRGQAWLATKLSRVNGRAEGLAQFNDTLRRLNTDQVALLQVHNLGDLKTQLALARELKAQGKIRYVGVTHYQDRAHDEIAAVLRAESPDFVQINYSVVSRNAERRVLPTARDLGVAVIVNRAFEDGRLFQQVAGKALPEWAQGAGITSWAQAFLKFALSHRAVTVVIPATGKPDRQSDNLRAGIGPDLTEELRQSLIRAVG